MHYSETGIAKSLFKHFQGYLGIFGDTDTYSATHRHTTRGQGESGGKGGKGGQGGERGGERRPLLPFLKNENSTLILERKALIVPILKFSMKNVVLKRIYEKKLQKVGPLFLVFGETFVEVSS